MFNSLKRKTYFPLRLWYYNWLLCLDGHGHCYRLLLVVDFPTVESRGPLGLGSPFVGDRPDQQETRKGLTYETRDFGPGTPDVEDPGDRRPIQTGHLLWSFSDRPSSRLSNPIKKTSTRDETTTQMSSTTEEKFLSKWSDGEEVLRSRFTWAHSVKEDI